MALCKGREPPPGAGSRGSGRKGPKEGSGKPDAAKDYRRMTGRDEDADMTRGQEEAPWRRRGWGSGSSNTWGATTAATWGATWSANWWEANGEQMNTPAKAESLGGE